jgi:hypothetical protein
MFYGGSKGTWRFAGLGSISSSSRFRGISIITVVR